MPDEIKRLHYYDQQFLREPDFTDEQKYHMEMRRRHNRLMHGWGIVEGLSLSKMNDHTITVAAGMAIDANGREIVLQAPQDIVMPSGTGERNKNYYVTIRYKLPEDLTDPPPPQDVITPADRTRVTERPDFPAPALTVADPGTTLILGRVHLDNAGDAPITVPISEDGRHYVPGVVPTGAIIIWTGATCPAGYERVAELDGKFLRGAAQYNASAGGSDTHTHSLPAHQHTTPNHNHSIPDHNHNIPSHNHAIQNHNHTIPNHDHTIPSHTHYVNGGATSSTGSSQSEINGSGYMVAGGNPGDHPEWIHTWHHHTSPSGYSNNNSAGLNTNQKSNFATDNKVSFATDAKANFNTDNKTSLNTNATTFTTDSGGSTNAGSASTLPVYATVLLCRKK